MPVIKYNSNEPRFKDLNPVPLPLIKSDIVWDLLTRTKDWLYNCLCPISENAIFIDEEWSIWCDVNLDWRTHCKVIWLEHNICPYRDNMK